MGKQRPKKPEPFERLISQGNSVGELIEAAKKRRDERRQTADKILAKPLRKR